MQRSTESAVLSRSESACFMVVCRWHRLPYRGLLYIWSVPPGAWRDDTMQQAKNWSSQILSRPESHGLKCEIWGPHSCECLAGREVLYHHFGGTCSLHLQCRRVGSSEISIPVEHRASKLKRDCCDFYSEGVRVRSQLRYLLSCHLRFPQRFEANSRTGPQLGHDRFLPHSFQFIIHRSSYHSLLCCRRYRSLVKPAISVHKPVKYFTFRYEFAETPMEATLDGLNVRWPESLTTDGSARHNLIINAVGPDGHCLGHFYISMIFSNNNNVVFLISWGGVRLSPLGTSATNSPVVPPPDDRWWMWSSRWNENWQALNLHI
jgi:hypothetical protein